MRSSALLIAPPGNRKRRRSNVPAAAGIVVGAGSAFKLSPTTVGRGCSVPNSPARLVHLVAQSLAGLERRGHARVDVDRFTRGGIASSAGIPPAGAERAEAGDGDGFVLCKGIADGGEHGRDHAVGLGPGEREVRGDVRRELGLVQVCFSLLRSRCGPERWAARHRHRAVWATVGQRGARRATAAKPAT